MYTFEILYDDNTKDTIKNIIKVEYQKATRTVTVTAEEILTHQFPLGRDITLFSKDAQHTINGQKVKRITILQ